MPKKEHVQPFHIYQLLPRTNCKQCGFISCFAFATALLSREKSLKDCPEVFTDRFGHLLPKLRGFIDEEAGEVEKTGLLIKRERCNGCGDCVPVCAQAVSTIAFHSGIAARRTDKVPQVLQIVDGVVQVVNWSSCKRCAEPPALCKVCEERCPLGALELVRRGVKPAEA